MKSVMIENLFLQLLKWYYVYERRRLNRIGITPVDHNFYSRDIFFDQCFIELEDFFHNNE